MPRSTVVRLRRLALGAVLSLAPSTSAAHDVPGGLTVQAFLKPHGERLRLLVRVPLGAMRDVDFPRRGPGYLDLGRADASLREAARLWISGAVEMYEDDTRLPEPQIVAVRVSLPSDRSFGSYDAAFAHVTGRPLPSGTELYWNQALLDVLLECPIRSETGHFSIRPAFGRLGQRVVTSLRLVAPDGAVRPFELLGDPGLVRLDPRWHQAALRFVGLGFLHILAGPDHLLFLLCLVVPLRQLRALFLVVTSFTLAHSITLIASAFEAAPQASYFPHLVETLIAASIVYMALENVLLPQPARRWMIAFAFGLVHGFGFAFGLQQTLQFAGAHLVTALLSFNVGVELGQLLVLALLLPPLVLLRRAVPERAVTIVLSALVAHSGWHWMIERGDRLRQFSFPRAASSAALLAGGLRWLMLLVAAAGLAWLVFGVLLRAGRDAALPQGNE